MGAVHRRIGLEALTLCVNFTGSTKIIEKSVTRSCYTKILKIRETRKKEKKETGEERQKGGRNERDTKEKQRKRN